MKSHQVSLNCVFILAWLQSDRWLFIPGLWFKVNGLRNTLKIEYHLHDIFFFWLMTTDQGVCCGAAASALFLTSRQRVHFPLCGMQAAMKSGITKCQQSTVAKWQPWKPRENIELWVSSETPSLSSLPTPSFKLTPTIPQRSLKRPEGRDLSSWEKWSCNGKPKPNVGQAC